MNRFQRFIDDYVRFPFYLLTHPVAGFDELKREKKGKFHVAMVFMFLLGVLNILSYQYAAFLVNDNNPANLNSLRILATIGFAVILLTVGNWSITTLFDGKGSFKEIFMVFCYAMFPMILIGFPNILLSYIFVLEETAFYHVLNAIGAFLTVFLAFMGLLVIHEYSLTRTILTVLATFVAIAVILFIGLLFFNIVQQIIALIVGLYNEITWRYF
ncbi:MAG TPA: Yip1 family protein [Haloplasmataceae bacterium]